MVLVKFCYVSTSQVEYVHVDSTQNRRLSVEPSDVIVRSSLVKCAVRCHQTAWCFAANLAPDTTTCQLLSDEVSDETSLPFADGWNYIRTYAVARSYFFVLLMGSFLSPAIVTINDIKT